MGGRYREGSAGIQPSPGISSLSAASQAHSLTLSTPPSLSLSPGPFCCLKALGVLILLLPMESCSHFCPLRKETDLSPSWKTTKKSSFQEVTRSKQELFCDVLESSVFPPSPPIANNPARSNSRRRHTFYRQAWDRAGTTSQRGSGVRHPGAEHPVPETGSEFTQGLGAAAQAG